MARKIISFLFFSREAVIKRATAAASAAAAARSQEAVVT